MGILDFINQLYKRPITTFAKLASYIIIGWILKENLFNHIPKIKTKKFWGFSMVVAILVIIESISRLSNGKGIVGAIGESVGYVLFLVTIIFLVYKLKVIQFIINKVDKYDERKIEESKK